MVTEGPGAVFRALFPVVAVLDSLRIPYAITGSLASGLHGEVRSTRDADVLVDLGSTGIEPLLATLQAEF
jgi:hypothetical protein